MPGKRRSRRTLSYELTYVIYIGSEKLQTSLGGRRESFMGIKHFMQQFPGLRTPKPIFHKVLFETYVESVTQFYEFHIYRLYRLKNASEVIGGHREGILGVKHFMQQFPANEDSQTCISHSFVQILRRKCYLILRL